MPGRARLGEKDVDAEFCLERLGLLKFVAVVVGDGFVEQTVRRQGGGGLRCDDVDAPALDARPAADLLRAPAQAELGLDEAFEPPPDSSPLLGR